MRSIGKVRIKELYRIVDEIWNCADSPNDLRDRIQERIPEDWFETWESAWSEIERLINDRIRSQV